MTDRASAEGLSPDPNDPADIDAELDVEEGTAGVDLGRASAEGLRDLLWNRQMPDNATMTVTLGELREAFRDHSDSGDIDVERVRVALGVLYPWQSGPTNAKDASRFAREYARASTPRTETSEPAATPDRAEAERAAEH
ncbi:MAG TPA: hypothetical protein VJT72_07855 [Pseudonocardiaceae bacterium]|nr:hypothetical protein [Pseudonocardiaceae bacterium]